MEKQVVLVEENETVVEDKKNVKQRPVVTKKEETLNPRLASKLDELRRRGLLTTAKAYVPPQDGMTRYNK